VDIKIRIDTHITDEEQRHLFGWGDDIYDDNCYGLTWRPRDRRFFVYADNQLVGHIGFVKQVVRVGTQSVLVGGVGQVVTVPTAQQRGYATQALRAAAAFLKDELEVVFGLLFCIPRKVPFYERLGWQHIHDTVVFQQPEGNKNSPMPVMVLPCTDQHWPAGVVDLQSLPW
jgi:GNAT superfamily N-acetyltransferase